MPKRKTRKNRAKKRKRDDKVSKKKILFAVQNLNIGGIQKAFVNLVNALYADGKYEITVFAFADGALLKELPENIRVCHGGKLLRLTAESR